MKGPKLPAVQEIRVKAADWEDPWRRDWLPTPVFLPGKFHGQRSLVGYSPCDHKELDRLEAHEVPSLYASIHEFQFLITLLTSKVNKTSGHGGLSKMIFMVACYIY